MTATSTPTAIATATSPLDVRRLAIATGAATLANLAVFAVGSLSGATWQAGQPYPISWPMVVGFSIIPAALAGVVVSRIVKARPKALKILAIAGLVFAVVSAPAGSLMSQDLPTGLALGAMHVIAGLGWYFGIKPTAIR